MDLSEKAQIAAGFLTRKTIKREGEDERVIVTRAENAPEWMQELTFAAHEERLPDDYKYEYIEAALDLLADGYTADNIEPDVYTHDLTAWLHSTPYRVYYMSEALERGGYQDGFDLLMAAQEMERAEVFHAVERFLEALDEDELDETA